MFALSVASANDPEATVIVAVPPDEAEAVNVAVKVVPEPDKVESVPSVTEMSLRVNVDVGSLEVNVMVDVPPDETDAGLALMVMVGAEVS